MITQTTAGQRRKGVFATTHTINVRAFLSDQCHSVRTMLESYKALFLLVSVFWVSSFVVSEATAGEQADESTVDPIQLINEMSSALKSLTYRGTFVHMFEGNVESMLILHANDDISIRERMVSLNGEAREVYRNNALVTCIWPGSKSIIRSKSKPRNLLPIVSEALTQSEFYEFTAEKDDRVAGLEAHVVSVNPKDSYRYGYRFWIDKESRMLLRSLLIDSNERIIEQIMFTEITFPDSISDEELDADISVRKSYSWIENTDDAEPQESEAAMVGFDQLPAGYTKVSETYRPMPINDSAISHVMLSDGMASISVYVEYIKEKSGDTGSTGVSKMGALNAFGRSMDNAFVTVVGEVPVATVKAIGKAVKILQSSN